MSVSKRDENFLYVFRPGQFYLFTGIRGSGKTTKAAHCAVRALEMGYAVLSNIVLKRLTPNGWVEGYPTGYHKCVSWVEVMRLLPDLLEARKRILLVVDEAVLSGLGAGMTTLSQDVRAVLGLATLLRKLNAAWILIALDEQATMTRFRAVGPVINAIWRSKSTFDKFEIETRLGKFDYSGFVPEGFARPESQVADGEFVFETTASASFVPGMLHERRFNLMAALEASANCIREDVPERIRQHLERKPLIPAVESEQVLPTKSGEDIPPARSMRREIGHIQGAVDALIVSGMNCRTVREETGCSESFYYKRKRTLKMEGVV